MRDVQVVCRECSETVGGTEAGNAVRWVVCDKCATPAPSVATPDARRVVEAAVRGYEAVIMAQLESGADLTQQDRKAAWNAAYASALAATTPDAPGGGA